MWSLISYMPTPNKNSGHQDPGEFPWLWHRVAGRKCFPYNSTGKGQLKLAPIFSRTLFYIHFTFADFNLYPVTIINCNPGYNRKGPDGVGSWSLHLMASYFTFPNFSPQFVFWFPWSYIMFYFLYYTLLFC